MSGETKDPAEVEKIITEGGDALKDALLADLNRVDGNSTTLEPKSLEPNEKKNGQNLKPDAEEESEDDAGEDPKKPKEGDEGEAPDADDGSDNGTEKDKAGSKRTGKGKKGKVQNLLSQRNSARDEARHEREMREKAEQAKAELEKKLAQTKLQDEDPTGEDLESDDDSSDDETEDIDKLLDKKLDERDKRRERASRKADLDKQEREELISEHQPTQEELDGVDELLKTHPTLSDKSALRVVSPHRFVDGARNDARKLEVGTNTRRDLNQDPSPDKMPLSDLEKMIRDEEKSGRLRI